MHVDGRCLCGAVRFQAEVEPKLVFLCNCTDCQNQSGAFRVVAPVASETFLLIAGELRFFDKRAESGVARRLAFCEHCGTPIYGSAADTKGGPLSLRVGPLEQRAELPPVARLWCRSELDWVASLSELPRIETQPRPAS